MPDSKTLSVKPIIFEICTGIKEGWFERFKLGGDRSQLHPNEDGLARERAIASVQSQEQGSHVVMGA